MLFALSFVCQQLSVPQLHSGKVGLEQPYGRILRSCLKEQNGLCAET
jgi:hypothetical protein